jgi:hypothetical protein
MLPLLPAFSYVPSDAPHDVWEVPAPAPAPPPPHRDWFVRAHLGVVESASSEEQSALAADGYDSGRYLLGLDAAWMPSEWIGVGPVVEYAARNTTPSGSAGDRTGPSLSEKTIFVAAQAPIVLSSGDTFAFVLAPRLGFAYDWLSFAGPSTGTAALAYGVNASCVFPKVHLGFTAGLWRAPMHPAAELARSYDAGGFTFALTGWFDG